MKKFVLAFGIPVLAVASLIGSGYATWYFNNAVDAVNGKIGVNIEPEKVVGAKFQQHGDGVNGVNLVLDQSDKTATDGMPTGRKGVHFNGAFSVSLVADDGDVSTTDDKFVSGISYKITTTITIPSEVAKYVNFTFKGSTASENGLTLTKESTYTVEANQQAHDFFKISCDTSNTDVTVAYADEPTTLDAYKIMEKDVSGKNIDISFTAEIVTVTK